MSEIQTIGARVRLARRYRGMTQEQLAGLSGLSQSFISSIESGARELSRRQDIAAIAKALRVAPTDLTLQPVVAADPEAGAAAAAVPDVRQALLTTGLDYTDDQLSRPLPQLEHDAYEATRLRVEDRAWGDLGDLLPALIRDTHAAALEGRDRDSALEALVLTLVNTASWLKTIGFVDLAWVAADRARQAALLRNDPLWLAYGHWCVAVTQLALGTPTPAARSAARGAQLAPTSDDGGLAMFGMLRLMSALTTTATGGDASGALAEAAEVAERTGEHEPDPFKVMFGPTNVRLWQLSITLEQDDPDETVRLGREVNPSLIPLAERKSGYHKDMGLALAKLRLDRDAVEQLRAAERLDPDRIRNHPIVRDAVAGMLARARREAGGRELRGLASRMGVAGAS